MSYASEKRDKPDIEDPTAAVPHLVGAQDRPQETPDSKEQFELGRLRSSRRDASDNLSPESLGNQEQGEEQDTSRMSPRAIPTSYKIMAFSMIIFFNTSSSFSESTLSPLKGIFRAELGVTSKYLSVGHYRHSLTV
jgi:hypothetical protein